MTRDAFALAISLWILLAIAFTAGVAYAPKVTTRVTATTDPIAHVHGNEEAR